jgi:hypothetical protein
LKKKTDLKARGNKKNSVETVRRRNVETAGD